MKNLDLTFQSKLAESIKQPVALYMIELTTITLRYAASRKDILFPAGGTVWYAKGAAHRGLTSDSVQQGTGNVTVTFADANSELKSFNRADRFIGKRVTCYQIFRDITDTESVREEVFCGIVKKVSLDAKSFTLDVTMGGTLRHKVPRRTYVPSCPWQPGGIECNQDGLLDNSQAPHMQSGTATVTASDTLIDANRTEADDSWKWGTITITQGNQVDERRVIDSTSAGVLVLDTPIVASISDVVSYTLRRGCNRTWDACLGNQAFGATDDNTANYGGFIHLERESE